ncbi:MAG: hypothetical protein D6811_12625 [Alphaproteobacteria bacterium]|nr:MAG: hypothetical protein D6811_12625 [Alphaproteobacteria bacterium]
MTENSIYGSSDPDILVGTDGNDIFYPYGTNVQDEPDVMRGLDGADTYITSPPPLRARCG